MSTNQDQQNFNALSAALTGLAQDALAPSVDPIGLPELFFETAQQALGVALFSHLLEQYATLLAAKNTPEQIAAAVLGATGSDSNAPAARAIMKLWLLGVWFPPPLADGSAGPAPHVVSDQAYKESWAWRIAQAHPMGYSQFHFGYWASEPPSLEAFTGVTASGGQA
ncbi:MAG: sorbitol dehydrogenase [Pseudomonadota bacterium]